MDIAQQFMCIQDRDDVKPANTADHTTQLNKHQTEAVNAHHTGWPTVCGVVWEPLRESLPSCME
jgi:hypothetical protein